MKFQKVLEENGISVAPAGHRHAGSGWLNFDCPFCGRGTGKFHMGYNLRGRYVNCWSCGSHRLMETLEELLSVDSSRAKRLLHGLDDEVVHWEERVRGRLQLPAGLGPLLPAHKNYLRSRNFNPNHLQRLWKLQGIGLAPRLSWRIFIPILHHGQTVSWTTRGIGGDSCKRYINAFLLEESIPCKELLFGEDYARQSLVICEGPFDVFNVGPGAVATLGTSYTPAQVLRMVEYPVRAVCFDNEPGAQQRADKLCRDLEMFPGKTYNVVLDSKDPGSASKREVSRLRKHFLD